MANSVKLEVITPKELFYENEIELVIVRTMTGEEGFMANHSWACKLLSAGEMYIQEVGSGPKEFKIASVSGGFIDVKDDIVIYADTAEWSHDTAKGGARRR
jgi:F-type H+-transporting ATPase subunit epsilon